MHWPIPEFGMPHVLGGRNQVIRFRHPRPFLTQRAGPARSIETDPGEQSPGSPSAAWTHRADIEGLRAIAVVLVVLFHAQLGPFSGGFVGVDVFFVLSGYLISGLLLRELAQTGSISLSAFYARRIRRLLPAALLVLLVTMTASVLWLPPLLVPGVAGDVAAAAAYVSNMGFAVQATDYFAYGQSPSPVLHYWSLGVEEQFYLFWPALLLFIAWIARGRGHRVGLAVAGITTSSFLLSLWLTSTNAPWAFFSLPTRAWELGLGAIVAIGSTRIAQVPVRLASTAGWLGLAMIVTAGLLFDESTPFPGTAAVLPTVGAALVVIGGLHGTRSGPSLVLGRSGPRFLGRVSYSLYLWHWPVLVIPMVALGAPLPVVARLALVVAAVLLAAATHRFVEEPIRRGRLVGTRPHRNLAFAGAVTLTVAIVSMSVGLATAATLRAPASVTDATANELSVDSLLASLAPSPAGGSVGQPVASPAPEGRSAAGDAASMGPTGAATPDATPQPAAAVPAEPVGPPSPAPAASTGAASSDPAPDATAPAAAIVRAATVDGPVPSDLQPSIGDAQSDYPASYLDGCHTQMDGHPNQGTCLYGNLASPTTIALFGDSHALAWFPAVKRFVDHQGWRLLSLTMSTCSPARIPIYVSDWKRISWECNTWREQAIEQLEAVHPALIIVTGTRGFATTDSSGTNVLTGDARIAVWQAGMQQTLTRLSAAARRVIWLADTPLSRVDPPVCLSQHPTSTLACATPVEDAINPAWLALESNAASTTGTGFIDPQRWVCPSNPCPVVLGNLLIYRDAGHLTATFAAALAGQLGSAILADLRHQAITLP
jgi:peptidoglycan/LPS O-acetylase OafA/YrhL